MAAACCARCWRRRLGYARATQIAAIVGQALAFALGLLGLFGNPLLIFIALFVYLAAASEAHAVQMREVSRGVLAERRDGHPVREPAPRQPGRGCGRVP